MAIALPKRRQPLAGIPLVYDGLGSRSKWGRALAELEQRGAINITWHEQSALIALILTQSEQNAWLSCTRPNSPPF
jgi:hypothetical protein